MYPLYLCFFICTYFNKIIQFLYDFANLLSTQMTSSESGIFMSSIVIVFLSCSLWISNLEFLLFNDYVVFPHDVL